MFDNSGRLVGEINHVLTTDGKSITTNTVYNGATGRALNQTVSVADRTGKVSTSKILNGKLLP